MMKQFYAIFSATFLLGGALAGYAQQNSGDASVEKRLQELEQHFKQQQETMQSNFERLLRQQQDQIDALKSQLSSATNHPPSESAAPGTVATTTTNNAAAAAEQKKLEAELAAELGAGATNATTATAAATSAASGTKTWTADQPITIARAGSAYMNISFDALMDVGGSSKTDPSEYLELGDHDPLKRGFTMPNAEIALDGAVDPYFKGFANIVLKLDQNNETDIELEETYLQSTSLPGNLQVKAGQFFAAFGRQNAQHPHQWAFVDAPIILTRTFGPEGLRNLGAQGSWLLPLPFFTELSLGIFDGQGNTAFNFRNEGESVMGTNMFRGRTTHNRTLNGLGDLVYVPRISSSFDVADSQTIVAGLSGAVGPNDTGSDARTEIIGGDLYWKWKRANADAGFPFVSWQTEALAQWFHAGADPAQDIPSETLRDWGVYSQVLWGFKPRWVAGLRAEYATGNSSAYDLDDPFRGERTRIAPVLTFYPSEFSKIRVQYNYDHGEIFGDAHSIWLQMEFLLGAHGAHNF